MTKLSHRRASIIIREFAAEFLAREFGGSGRLCRKDAHFLCISEAGRCAEFAAALAACAATAIFCEEFAALGGTILG